MRTATDDWGLGGCNGRQRWALLLIASRPGGFADDELARMFGITSAALIIRIVRPLVEAGYVESHAHRLAATEYGAGAADAAMRDPIVRQEVDDALSEWNWFRSES